MQPRRAAAVAVFTVAVVALPGVAQAKYSATGSGSARVGATTLQNASAFTAACASNTPNSTVNLSWTASPDAFVTSYVITRTGTGGSVTLPAVTAPATTSSDAPPVGAGNTYTYTIVAKVQNWVTPASAGSTISYTGGGGLNKCQ